MSDIFREVDEEVRQDRALAFWTRYQTAIIVLALLVVAGAGGWRIWANQKQAKAEADGALYQSAVQAARDGRRDQAMDLFDRLAREGEKGYREIAALRAAGEFAAFDSARALKGFDALASNTGLDPLFRETARLRAGIVALDTGDLKDAKARLEPLAMGSQPYRSTARELLATIALSEDDLPAAGRWLDEIVRDPAAPQDVRQRADAFLALVRSGRKPAK